MAINIGLYISGFFYLCSNAVLAILSKIIYDKTLSNKSEAGFINLLSEIFFYLQLAVLGFWGYFYILLCFYCCVRTEKCLTAIGCLLLPVYPCMIIAIYIYILCTFIIMIIFIILYCAKDSYPEIKTDMLVFLIFIGINFVFCGIFGKCSSLEKDNIKTYHTELVAVYEVRTDTNAELIPVN